MKSFSYSVIEQQTDIFSMLRGSDLDAKRDEKRLGAGYQRTLEVMKDGQWRTPEAMAKQSGNRIDSALRYWRYMKQAGHECNKKYVRDGLYLYQVIPN